LEIHERAPKKMILVVGGLGRNESSEVSCLAVETVEG